jgi:hypothetical protein
VPVQKVPKGTLLEEDLIILANFGRAHLIEIESEVEGDPTFLQEYLEGSLQFPSNFSARILLKECLLMTFLVLD